MRRMKIKFAPNVLGTKAKDGTFVEDSFVTSLSKVTEVISLAALSDATSDVKFSYSAAISPRCATTAVSAAIISSPLNSTSFTTVSSSPLCTDVALSLNTSTATPSLSTPVVCDVSAATDTIISSCESKGTIVAATATGSYLSIPTTPWTTIAATLVSQLTSVSLTSSICSPPINSFSTISSALPSISLRTPVSTFKVMNSASEEPEEPNVPSLRSVTTSESVTENYTSSSKNTCHTTVDISDERSFECHVSASSSLDYQASDDTNVKFTTSKITFTPTPTTQSFINDALGSTVKSLPSIECKQVSNTYSKLNVLDKTPPTSSNSEQKLPHRMPFINSFTSNKISVNKQTRQKFLPNTKVKRNNFSKTDKMKTVSMPATKDCAESHEDNANNVNNVSNPPAAHESSLTCHISENLNISSTANSLSVNECLPGNNESVSGFPTTVMSCKIAEVSNNNKMINEANNTTYSHSKLVDTDLLSKTDNRIFKERRLKFKEKFSEIGSDIEQKKLTMFDYIYFNPESNPMPRRAKPLSSSKSTSEDGDTAMERTREETVDDVSVVKSVASAYNDKNLESETSDDCSNFEGKPSLDEQENSTFDSLAPRLKIGPNGEVIVDQQSLVMQDPYEEERMKCLSSKVIEEDEYTRKCYTKKRKRACDWSANETAYFYKALSVVGTDFQMMHEIFFKKFRTREELKTKYKKEERTNHHLLNAALKDHVQYDTSVFEAEPEFDPVQERLNEREAERASQRRRKQAEQFYLQEQRLQQQHTQQQRKLQAKARKKVLKRTFKTRRRGRKQDKESDYEDDDYWSPSVKASRPGNKESVSRAIDRVLNSHRNDWSQSVATNDDSELTSSPQNVTVGSTPFSIVSNAVSSSNTTDNVPLRRSTRIKKPRQLSNYLEIFSDESSQNDFCSDDEYFLTELPVNIKHAKSSALIVNNSNDTTDSPNQSRHKELKDLIDEVSAVVFNDTNREETDMSVICDDSIMSAVVQHPSAYLTSCSFLDSTLEQTLFVDSANSHDENSNTLPKQSPQSKASDHEEIPMEENLYSEEYDYRSPISVKTALQNPTPTKTVDRCPSSVRTTDRNSISAKRCRMRGRTLKNTSNVDKRPRRRTRMVIYSDDSEDDDFAAQEDVEERLVDTDHLKVVEDGGGNYTLQLHGIALDQLTCETPVKLGKRPHKDNSSDGAGNLKNRICVSPLGSCNDDVGENDLTEMNVVIDHCASSDTVSSQSNNCVHELAFDQVGGQYTDALTDVSHDLDTKQNVISSLERDYADQVFFVDSKIRHKFLDVNVNSSDHEVLSLQNSYNATNTDALIDNKFTIEKTNTVHSLLGASKDTPSELNAEIRCAEPTTLNESSQDISNSASAISDTSNCGVVLASTAFGRRADDKLLTPCKTTKSVVPFRWNASCGGSLARRPKIKIAPKIVTKPSVCTPVLNISQKCHTIEEVSSFITENVNTVSDKDFETDSQNKKDDANTDKAVINLSSTEILEEHEDVIDTFTNSDVLNDIQDVRQNSMEHLNETITILPGDLTDELSLEESVTVASGIADCVIVDEKVDAVTGIEGNNTSTSRLKASTQCSNESSSSATDVTVCEENRFSCNTFLVEDKIVLSEQNVMPILIDLDSEECDAEKCTLETPIYELSDCEDPLIVNETENSNLQTNSPVFSLSFSKVSRQRVVGNIPERRHNKENATESSCEKLTPQVKKEVSYESTPYSQQFRFSVPNPPRQPYAEWRAGSSSCPKLMNNKMNPEDNPSVSVFPLRVTPVDCSDNPINARPLQLKMEPDDQFRHSPYTERTKSSSVTPNPFKFVRLGDSGATPVQLDFLSSRNASPHVILPSPYCASSSSHAFLPHHHPDPASKFLQMSHSPAVISCATSHSSATVHSVNYDHVLASRTPAVSSASHPISTNLQGHEGAICNVKLHTPSVVLVGTPNPVFSEQAMERPKSLASFSSSSYVVPHADAAPASLSRSSFAYHCSSSAGFVGRPSSVQPTDGTSSSVVPHAGLTTSRLVFEPEDIKIQNGVPVLVVPHRGTDYSKFVYVPVLNLPSAAKKIIVHITPLSGRLSNNKEYSYEVFVVC